MTAQQDVRGALQACIDDPMWADHAEVPKALLQRGVVALSQQAEIRDKTLSEDDRTDVINTILWMYRRLENNYGRLPFVEGTLKVLGYEGEDS